MMSNQSIILHRIKQTVHNHDPNAKIYLYGSRARGNAKPDSDWDLLILLNDGKITLDIERNITYPLYDLEIELGEVISPMVYSEEEWDSKHWMTPYYKAVMREGILL